MEKFNVPKFENQELKFKGSRFDVRSLQVAGRHHTTTKDVIVHPGACVILPIIDEMHLVMIRNERFAIGQELWELPAGTLDKNESLIEAAKRELIEETGYRAASIYPLFSFYTSPGICNEAMYSFVAKELTFVGQALEDCEKITSEIVSWKSALTMIQAGTIIDGKTIATLLFYHVFQHLQNIS